MTVPSINIQGSQARGPAGTEAMGVSVAIPVGQTMDDTGLPWTEPTWQDFIRESAPQLLEMLRVHVGGIQPSTEPSFNVDGPHSDPIQGPIYVMTAMAWFPPAALPVDCPAYQAWSGSRG